MCGSASQTSDCLFGILFFVCSFNSNRFVVFLEGFFLEIKNLSFFDHPSIGATS